MKLLARDRLEASIQYWEKILLGKVPIGGPAACALCIEYNKTGMYCDGCPVKEATGRAFCEDTPYEMIVKIEKARDNCWGREIFISDRLVYPIYKELEFLRSLRP